MAHYRRIASALSMLLLTTAGCGSESAQVTDSQPGTGGEAGASGGAGGTAGSGGSAGTGASAGSGGEASVGGAGGSGSQAGAENDAGLPGDDAGGSTQDAEPAPDSAVCGEGYTGVDCKQCAEGYQDDDNNGTCTLGCDASGANAPSCGHGTCFISPMTGERACQCDAGYAGDACDTCAQGWSDPEQNGVCVEGCSLNCGAHGSCVGVGAASVCECEAGYDGASCDACASGYVANAGACELDMPSETGLAIWLDADKASSLGVSQSNPVNGVQSWADRRGGAISLSAAAADNRPIAVAAALNGRGVVRFDGANDYLQLLSTSALSGEDYTIMMAFDASTLSTTGLLTAVNNDPAWAISASLVTAGTGLKFDHRTPLNSAQDGATVQGLAPSALNVAGMRRWTSGILDHIRVTAWDNGTADGAVADDNTLVTAAIGQPLRLLLGVDKDTKYFKGDLAEVLIYSRALDATEIVRVQEYLAAKWGKK